MVARIKKAKLPVPSEASTQAAILEYLNMRGHFAVRINTMGVAKWNKKKEFDGFRKSPMKGVSDILGVSRNTGKFFAIEVKKKYNKPSPEQITFIENVQSRGGIGIIAYSLDDVTEIL